PFFLRELIERGHEHVVFFKQESLVTGKLTPLFETLKSCSILLAPHLLAPLSGADGVSRELNILLSGVFNVGCLGVRNTQTALHFLQWWDDRLQDHCRHDVVKGMHFEQRWLDLVPAYFDDVKFCRDPGINVGHWNLPEREVRGDRHQLTVDGHPCRFVRFSGYDPANPDQPTRYNQRLHAGNMGPIRKLFSSFHQQLIAAGFWETQTWWYSHSRFDNGVPIPAMAQQLFREFENLPPQFENPFATGSSSSYYHWLNTSSMTRAPKCDSFRLTPLWKAVYDIRPDLQAAFPNVENEDYARFHQWTIDYGLRECGVPPEFLMATPEIV
ncbi:MAG: hypothetical protein KDA84_04760, partial [Planctomycetaceae bacterium]|nr:hypothetical protein [Planctomycetaceae bacterium]